jgi:hypothetical protein
MFFYTALISAVAGAAAVVALRRRRRHRPQHNALGWSPILLTGLLAFAPAAAWAQATAPAAVGDDWAGRLVWAAMLTPFAILLLMGLTAALAPASTQTQGDVPEAPVDQAVSGVAMMFLAVFVGVALTMLGLAFIAGAL